MSALEIKKRDEHLGRAVPLLCEGGCDPRAYGRDDPRQGVRVAFICGRPAASLCSSCAKAWEKAWGEAA